MLYLFMLGRGVCAADTSRDLSSTNLPNDNTLLTTSRLPRC